MSGSSRRSSFVKSEAKSLFLVRQKSSSGSFDSLSACKARKLIESSYQILSLLAVFIVFMIKLVLRTKQIKASMIALVVKVIQIKSWFGT